MNNPRSPGLTEDQCDAISERSALATLRQVKAIIASAGVREIRARMAVGQLFLDPFYAYAGPLAGCMTAMIDALWSHMKPDADPVAAAANLRELLVAMVDAQMADIVATPPGRETAALARTEAGRKGRMT